MSRPHQLEAHSSDWLVLSALFALMGKSQVWWILSITFFPGKPYRVCWDDCREAFLPGDRFPVCCACSSSGLDVWNDSLPNGHWRGWHTLRYPWKVSRLLLLCWRIFPSAVTLIFFFFFVLSLHKKSQQVKRLFSVIVTNLCRMWRGKCQ